MKTENDNLVCFDDIKSVTAKPDKDLIELGNHMISRSLEFPPEDIRKAFNDTKETPIDYLILDWVYDIKSDLMQYERCHWFYHINKSFDELIEDNNYNS